MGYITTLILTIIFIIQFYGANSIKNVQKLEVGPKTTGKNKPLLLAGNIVQQLTYQMPYVGQLYYNLRNKVLLYPNMTSNGTMCTWYESNGEVITNTFYELSQETIVIVIPTKNDPNKYIIGTNANALRLLTMNITDYTLSEPLVKINEKDHVMYAAHSDLNGVLFILFVGNTKDTEDSGKLYKIVKKKAQLVLDLKNKPRDFRFNFESTLMYMVHNGTSITEYKYNLGSNKFALPSNVFNNDDYKILENNALRSVALDRAPGHLWVAAAGKNGYILEINPTTKKIISTTPVPNKDLTFAVFGATDYNYLFVGSKGTCTEGIPQGSIYSITGMDRKGIPDRPIAWE